MPSNKVCIESSSHFNAGFITVDCGLADGSDYQDDETGVTYTSDSQFINTGENKILPFNQYARRYSTIRRFPNGTRNCYRLSPVQSGNKYVIRAGFYYGNYDGKNSFPIFDLYIGVNFWTTVKLDENSSYLTEIITVSQRDLIQVCLANTGKGTPFISTLELRPLLDFMYPFANASQSLAIQERWNYGGNNVRYCEADLSAFDSISALIPSIKFICPSSFIEDGDIQTVPFCTSCRYTHKNNDHFD